MVETVEAQSLAVCVSAGAERGTRTLVGVSGVALAAQVVVTDYGVGHAGAAGLWFAVGSLVLWLVYRKHSRAARGFIIVTSLVGAVVYGLGARGDARSAFLAVAFLAQALPLMSRHVRLHVQGAP